MIEKRTPGRFTERLSTFMVMVAAAGAFVVLVDPKIELSWITFNGDGFSADLKGAVISAILIGGWTAVKEYWLGSSATGAETGKSMSRIAEASAPTTAMAVAASRADPVPGVPGVPVKTDVVNVEATTAVVNEKDKP